MIDIKADNIKPQFNTSTPPILTPPKPISISTIHELKEIIKEGKRIANEITMKKNETIYQR